MNKTRMLKAADVLEKDANDPKGAKFDLTTWGCSAEEKMTLSCGTNACAMGVIALSGAFKRAGLTWSTESYPRYDAAGQQTDKLMFDMTIECGDGQGTGAAMELFGITDEVATWLFTPDAYPDSQHRGKRGELAVAKRMRAYVAGTKAPPPGEYGPTLGVA